MPTSITDITITLDTAAPPQETFNDVALIGTAASAPPDANFGEVNTYRSSNDVADDYGSGSDVAISSNALEEMGVEDWYVIVLEEKEVTGESLDDDASGTLENAPILGDPEATTGTGTLTHVAGTPDNTLSDGVELNPDTGDYYNAETGNTIDYSYVDWGVLESQFVGIGVDLPYIANKKYDVKNVGTLDEIVAWADSNEAATVAASINGNNAPDEQTAMNTAHDVFSYVPSGSLLGVAHKSSADVGAYIIGQAATNEPWFDVFYDGDGYPFDTEYYSEYLVGEPGDSGANGTFEGGDSANNEGPTNVIINKGGTTVLSNSLTTAGASSNYQFWDILRTENYAQTQVEDALTSLRLREDFVPFQQDGKTLIEDAIQDAFSGDVGDVDDPFSSLVINVPDPDSIPEEDVANRIYSGITVDGVLAGEVHEFRLSLGIEV